MLWLALIFRVTVPALRRATEERPLLSVFLMSTAAIALPYGAGFFWGRHTHLSIVEYWRGWIVHFWVEGYFEIFATSVIAFIFARLRLVDARLAATTTRARQILAVSASSREKAPTAYDASCLVDPLISIVAAWHS